MDFDWNNPTFEAGGAMTHRDIEESFEDPFAVRLLPDTARFAVQSRYFNLGMSAGGFGVFSVYRTNGKQVRVILSRGLEPEEKFLYQRKMEQALSQ